MQGLQPARAASQRNPNQALLPAKAFAFALAVVGGNSCLMSACAVDPAPRTGVSSTIGGNQDASKLPLQPLGQHQFFVQPNQAQTLKWQSQGGTTQFTCEVRNYRDKVVSTRKLDVQNGQLELALNLAPGFYELKFQPGGQTFGVVASVPHRGAPDTFFALDAALSWLETRPAMRTDLLAILKRNGIGLVRERLSWGAINPQVGQWDWQTNRQFDTLRQEYAYQGIKILELFHGAPAWAKTDAANPYPQRLNETKNSWQAMGKHWQGVWNSLEVWNEPDIESGGELPADQLLPTVKTINYGLRESKSLALVGGGVFGYFNPAYIANSVQNGLLDQVDFVSFHTYAKAPAMEQVIGDYRRALTVKGHAPIPLWLTESGQPWKSGQSRPGRDEDTNSALDIAMKAVEARACGIAHYFGFVYPYYVEGPRNFGMMGEDVTPLRSMAGYVQVVAALSGKTYIGDLKLAGGNVQRARVFAHGDEAVVVLYNENPTPTSRVPWKGIVSRLQSVDGSTLTRLPNGAIPLTDGLTYVHTALKSLTGISRQTTAAALLATAKSARSSRGEASALVIQPLPSAEMQPTKRGYKLAESSLSALPVNVRINNLSNAPKQVTLQGTVTGGTTLPARQIELAPHATQDVQWDVDLTPAVKSASSEALTLKLTGQEKGGVPLSGATLELFCERDLDTYLKLYPQSKSLTLTDLPNWTPKIASTGQMKMQVLEGHTWQLNTTFKGGDRWVFPELKVPANTDWRGTSGLIIRLRATAPATVRVMVKERNGSTYFTPFSLVAADGVWHSISLPWQDLAALPSAPPDPNSQLDLNQIESIALGMNSKADENTLEVSDFHIASKVSQVVRPTSQP